MRDRIYSLETEYAVTFLPAPDSLRPERALVVAALVATLTDDRGLTSSLFLANGSKFHVDVGHAEWSLPECRSAYQATVYDKAADFSIGQFLPHAEETLRELGYRGHLMVVKNNVDASGHTYGCHENYLTERETEWLESDDQLRLTARFLIPFLVTRQVYCGAGRVGVGVNARASSQFQLTQRADFLEAVISAETTRERAIFSIAREHEPLSAGNHRRLHLILGDANLSGWATFLKLGATGILLRMIEDVGFGEVPHLRDPLAAVRIISRDPTCTARVPMRNGPDLTAVEIQRLYHEQAVAYLRASGASAEEERVLRLWDEALTLLESDPMRLFGKADWVTKKVLLDRYLTRAGLMWKDVKPGDAAHNDLLRMDIQYHSLTPDEGLYCRMLGDRLDNLALDEEIRYAEWHAPAYTRAKVRGDVITAARRSDVPVTVDAWDKLEVNQGAAQLDDPMSFFAPAVLTLLQGQKETETAAEIRAADESEPSAVPDMTPEEFATALRHLAEIVAEHSAPPGRGDHSVLVYCRTSSAGNRLAEALRRLGYTNVELRNDPNNEFNIKWGSATTETVDEIARAMAATYGLATSQVHRLHVFLPVDNDIYINVPR